MTFNENTGLAVSLPAGELADMDLPASIIDPQIILNQTNSTTLRPALTLLLQQCESRGVPMVCVARPEIFTHGAAADWLHSRCAGISHHLCLSDGITVKTLVGFPTSIFFYRRAEIDPSASLATLERRAPEILLSVDAQINSEIEFSGKTPTPVLLFPNIPREEPFLTLWPFYMNVHSIDDTKGTIIGNGAAKSNSSNQYRRLRYLPLTQTALDDAPFVKMVATILLHAFFDPETLIILRLPTTKAILTASDQHTALSAALNSLHSALAKANVVFPKAATANIFLTLTDIDENNDFFQEFRFQLLIHASFDYWRYRREFYQCAASILIATTTVEPQWLPTDITKIYGPRATMRLVNVVGGR